LKLGLDIHGVITDDPEFFSKLTHLLVQGGHEVHILTGHHGNDRIFNKLKLYNVAYTHFFSIADYRKEQGVHVTYDEEGKPWLAEGLWNSAKSEYANKHKLDIHIDDTPVYGEYFITPFVLYRGKKGKEK
jgi:hypothetical protein